MNKETFQEFLTTKFATFLSWLSAFLGIGTAIGLVNLTVGILSALWLTAQLWNWWFHVRPQSALTLRQNCIKLQLLERELQEAKARTGHRG